MIIPDLNILLYATISASARHERARSWWETTLSGDAPVGLVAPVVFGFLRLATSRRVFDAPMSVDAAVGHVESWLARPNVEYLAGGPRQLQVALALVREVGAAGNLTTDVQIAAHALCVQGTVYTHDSDFARFERVARVYPLRDA
ncbi:MAG: TA system VapC family ribonuclease toxin [Myxococcota bacterium]